MNSEVWYLFFKMTSSHQGYAFVWKMVWVGFWASLEMKSQSVLFGNIKMKEFLSKKIFYTTGWNKILVGGSTCTMHTAALWSQLLSTTLASCSTQPCSWCARTRELKVVFLIKKNPYSYWESLQNLMWGSGDTSQDADSLWRLPQSRWSRTALVPPQLWPQPAPAARRAQAKPKWMGAGACRKCHHSCSRTAWLVSRKLRPRKSTALS